MVVRVMSSGAGNGSQLGDQLGQIHPQQRLSAGDPQLVDARGDEEGGQARYLLKREDFVLGQKLVGLAEDLGRHAVGTPEIAPVGDRDAEVSQGTAKKV